MTEERRDPWWVRCGEMTARDRRNLMRTMGILAVWAACFTLASQLIKRELVSPGPLAWGLAALPWLAGVWVLVSYARFLRQADELQRIVQLQALAFGFGGTFFAISGYQVLERLGLPAAAAGDFTMVMAVFFSIGSVVGAWRYR